MRLSSSRSFGAQLGLVELELQVVAAEVHHQAEGGAPRLRDLAEGGLQAVALGLGPLADPLRLGLRGRRARKGDSGLLARRAGLLSRRIGLLAGAKRPHLRHLPAFGRRAGRRIGGGRPSRACRARAVVSSVWAARLASCRSAASVRCRIRYPRYPSPPMARGAGGAGEGRAPLPRSRAGSTRSSDWRSRLVIRSASPGRPDEVKLSPLTYDPAPVAEKPADNTPRGRLRALYDWVTGSGAVPACLCQGPRSLPLARACPPASGTTRSTASWARAAWASCTRRATSAWSAPSP